MTRKSLALLALVSIVPVVGFQSSAQPAASDEKLSLSLDLIYDPETKIDFDGNPPVIVDWLGDGQHYVQEKTEPKGKVKQLLRVNAASGESVPLYDTDRIQQAFAGLPGMDDESARALASKGEFKFSPDESSVSILYDKDLYWYRFADDVAKRLTETSEEELEPAFSPDGKRLAFIRDHDLYVTDLESGSETRLTTGGGVDLFNGRLDWVYQEEIYGRGDFKGYWWSPDSRRILYLQLDESPVPSFTVIDHIPNDLVREVTRYPKAGDPNPNPRLGLIEADGGKTRWIQWSDEYKPADLLIVRAGWSRDGSRIVFQAQNKEQTWLDLNFASPHDVKANRVLRETTPAWVSVQGEEEWLADGSFLWLSERTGWNHVYHYSPEGALLGAVTSGEWEIDRLFGADKDGWVYFSATERSPIGSDVYRVRLDGTGLTRLSEKPGTHRAKFNKQLTLYVDAWSDISTPVQTRVHDSTGGLVRVVDDNPSETLSKYQLSPPEFLQVKTRDGFTMEALLIKPANFDASKRYPVLSFTYGGPHAPSVVNRWTGAGYLWHQMMAQKGYAVWICDNRTASGKGAVSTWPLYRNLGELELRDLEDGLTWLKGQPWVDGQRIGLWGWSYGGFMTSYALTHSKSFKIGVVGAPVTDWRLYDSVYTERYMATPANNPEGYSKSSVVKAAGDLSGKMLLLHGTIDDNVHIQNSIQFIYQLQKAGKQFQMMVYPKSRHGVRDPLQVKHMRTLMTRFVEDNL